VMTSNFRFRSAISEKDQSGLDRLAQPNLVGEHRPMRERRAEGKEGGLDLVRVQINLGIDERPGQLLDAVRRAPLGQFVREEGTVEVRQVHGGWSRAGESFFASHHSTTVASVGRIRYRQGRGAVEQSAGPCQGLKERAAAASTPQNRWKSWNVKAVAAARSHSCNSGKLSWVSNRVL